MKADQARRVVLGILLAILAVLLYRGGWGSATQTESTSGGRAPVPPVARVDPLSTSDLQLDRLERTSPASPLSRRNLFRFEDGDRTGGPPSGPQERSAGPPAVAVPLSPDDGATFTLIGIVEAAGESARVAVLSDGRGVYHGRAGDIIEGRFRLLSVDAGSAEIARLGDDTRHVIRLQGAARARGPATP